MYRNQGPLSRQLETMSQAENLIPFCSICHILFDATFPGHVILFTDIGFLITWENNDFDLRVKAASKGGKVPKRTFPSSGDYSGTF